MRGGCSRADSAKKTVAARSRRSKNWYRDYAGLLADGFEDDPGLAETLPVWILQPPDTDSVTTEADNSEPPSAQVK